MLAFDWGPCIDVALGFGLGVLGVIPFLHTNTILAFLPEASPLLVVVLAFCHLPFESLPAVFFGVPSAGHGLNALPAHQLVRQGHARAALDAVLVGIVGGTVSALALGVAFWFLGAGFYRGIKPLTEWLLLAVLVVVWFSDGWRLRHAAAFAMFGALGFFTFDLPLREPLFPLLSGLFGIPAVLYGGRVEGRVAGPPGAVPFWALASGGVLGAFSVFLPALSPSLLGSIALLIVPAGALTVVGLLSAISSSRLFFDFLGVWVLRTARSAPTVALQDAALSPADGVILLAVGLVGLLASVACVVVLARTWPDAARRLRPDVLSGALLLLALAGAWALDGGWGLFVLSWATAASLVALRQRIPRKYALGALVLPALVHAWAS